VFDIFRDTLDDVVLKKKEKEDIGVISGLAKRILPALDGDGPPGLQFVPLTLLRGRLELLSSDGLSGALAVDPGEEAAARWVECLLSVRVEAFEGWIPPFVEAVFRKNDKHLTAGLLRRLADLPAGLAAIAAIHGLLRVPIQNSLEANKAEAEGLLPLLWKCANVDEFAGRQPIAFKRKTAATGLPPRAPPAPRAPRAAAFGSRAAAFSGFTCSDFGFRRLDVMPDEPAAFAFAPAAQRQRASNRAHCDSASSDDDEAALFGAPASPPPVRRANRRMAPPPEAEEFEAAAAEEVMDDLDFVESGSSASASESDGSDADDGSDQL
jgi:hypothetical protein